MFKTVFPPKRSHFQIQRGLGYVYLCRLDRDIKYIYIYIYNNNNNNIFIKPYTQDSRLNPCINDI